MKLLDLIVCDDIRQEIGGKQSLIGVYSDLVINYPPEKKIQLPLNLKIGIFLRFKIDVEDSIPESFEINCIQNEKIIMTFNGNLKFPKDINYFNLAVVNNAFPIPNTGEIIFKISFKKDNKILYSFDPEYTLKVITKAVTDIKMS